MPTLLPNKPTFVGLEVPLEYLEPVTVFQYPEKKEAFFLLVEEQNTGRTHTVKGHYIPLHGADTVLNGNHPVENIRRFCNRLPYHAKQQ
jgi:hypothetical protein